MLADFHFMRPLWLLALIPAVILLLLLLLYKKQHSPWHQLIAPHLQNIMLRGQLQQHVQHFALPLLLLSWLITVVALAGPSWQKLPQPAYALKRATVLVLDMSMSMRATDMTPDRLTQLRFKALDFTEELTEGELALISFAGDAFVLSPLTPDHNNVRLLIPDLKPEIMPVQGSNLLGALQQADLLLRQAGYPKGDVVVFTDGFDPGSHKPIMDLLNSWPHRLSVMAFGTEQGAAVKLENGELLKNAQGSIVLPRTPLSQLAVMTQRSQGTFVSAGIGDQDIRKILSLTPLSALDQAQALEQLQGDQWQDNAVYLVWLLLPLALFLAKRTPVLLMLPLLFYFPETHAASWQDLWQTRQQQAVQHYQQQQYDDAQQKFTDPLWQGNAAYRNGNYQQAEQAFSQAANHTGSADAFHNLGNALAKQQRYQEALQAYDEALKKQPQRPETQQNRQLMEKLLQQQEQQNDSDQQQSDDNAEQQKQQNNEQSDDQQSQQQENGDSEGDNEQSAEQGNTADSKPETPPQQPEQQPLPQPQQETAQSETEPQQKQQAVAESWPNATPEQQQELNNLLRKVQDDPALLLRNKMYLEYQQRRQQALPKGVEQEW